MSSKYSFAILRDYENSLFSKSKTQGYTFNPNDEIDAEYYYHNLTYDLSELEGYDLPKAELIEIQSLIRHDPKIMRLPEVKKAIREKSDKLQAIKSWYEEQSLNLPSEISPFEDQDIWEAMVDGFWDRVKTRYEDGLAEVRKKFSQFDNTPREKDNSEREDWDGAIYALADEIRDRKDRGEFRTYKEAYKYGEDNYTVNGNPVTAYQLEKNYYKAKSTGKL